jgi:hypothetical protein
VWEVFFVHISALSFLFAPVFLSCILHCPARRKITIEKTLTGIAFPLDKHHSNMPQLRASRNERRSYLPDLRCLDCERVYRLNTRLSRRSPVKGLRSWICDDTEH